MGIQEILAAKAKESNIVTGMQGSMPSTPAQNVKVIQNEAGEAIGPDPLQTEASLGMENNPVIVGDPNLENRSNSVNSPANKQGFAPGAITTTKADPDVKGPKGSYRAQELHQFFKYDGSRVVPTDGFYIPADEEEERMLEHYAKGWNMVELQK